MANIDLISTKPEVRLYAICLALPYARVLLLFTCPWVKESIKTPEHATMRYPVLFLLRGPVDISWHRIELEKGYDMEIVHERE